MAQAKTRVEIRMRWWGRWTIKGATWAYLLGFALPGRLVKAVANRSWVMRVNNGRWLPLKLMPGGEWELA